MTQPEPAPPICWTEPDPCWAERLATKDALFLIGMHAWTVGYEKGLGDIETFEAVMASAPEHIFADELINTIRRAQFTWAGRWIENACPIIQLSGHRHAAALMSTGMPSATGLRAPWSSFLIELPIGLFGTITHVLVTCRRDELSEAPEEKWSIMAMGGSDSLHFLSQPPDKLCADDADGSDVSDAFLYEVSGLEARSVLLLRRLVVNTCVSMANSTARQIGKHPSDWTKGPPRHGPPAFRVFRVGKPIEMDCRPAIQAYLGGTRRDPLKVQFLVRGHWRHQTHGPGNELRKLIWIQPFWKGPEDAVILRRTHVVTEIQ